MEHIGQKPPEQLQYDKMKTRRTVLSKTNDKDKSEISWKVERLKRKFKTKTNDKRQKIKVKISVEQRA